MQVAQSELQLSIIVFIRIAVDKDLFKFDNGLIVFCETVITFTLPVLAVVEQIGIFIGSQQSIKILYRDPVLPVVVIGERLFVLCLETAA